MLRKYKNDFKEAFVTLYLSDACCDEKTHENCKRIYKYELEEDRIEFAVNKEHPEYVWHNLLKYVSIKLSGSYSQYAVRALCSCDCHEVKYGKKVELGTIFS